MLRTATALCTQHHRNDVMITLKRVVAGGLAGMLAKSVVAPVDRVKILFQVTNEKFSFKKVRVFASVSLGPRNAYQSKLSCLATKRS